MKIKEVLQAQLLTALVELNLPITLEQIRIERPAQSAHGEYSSPIALTIFSIFKKEIPDFPYSSPKQLAESISTKINTTIANKSASQTIKSVEVAGPGFINFSLTNNFYLQLATELAASQEGVYKPIKPAGSIIIEYVSPNTNKPLHIGHVRNAALGAAMGRILQQTGWNVQLGIINNDRGLHIIKSMWAYLMLGKKDEQRTDSSGETTADSSKPVVLTSTITHTNWQERLEDWTSNQADWLTPQDMPDLRLQKPDHFVGFWYQKGDSFAEDPAIQKVWTEMLQAWEGCDLPYHNQVRALWQHLNTYFYQGFTQSTAILEATFDEEEVSYESQIYEIGKEIVVKAAEAGIFEKLPDGAIKVALEKFKLPDKILLRRDGTGIYMTFDIELTRRRSLKKVDKVVWVVGVDQQLYFQQLFAVSELLGYGNREKFHHFAYGMVRLPEGKMSSRKGRVVYADDLLEVAQEKAREIMQQVGVAKDLPPAEFERVVAAVGVGAVKWTMLSQDAVSEITFNIEESVSFTGFAGPYIQYTLARTHSIFKKAKERSIAVSFDVKEDIAVYFDSELSENERDLFVSLSKYFDAVERAAQEYAPHSIATYLHELAQRFNTFYANHTIVSDNENESKKRLLLTKAVQQVLTEGLNLLGITAVERM